MTGQAADEHERTMAFANIALGQIKALRQEATPRNYEIWYAYATGYHPSLNQNINEILAERGNLTDAELESIYDDLSVADAAVRAHRQGRQPGDGRDRAGHGDDRRRRRLRQPLHRKPRRHDREARRLQGPRGPARHRRGPGADRQGDGGVQPQAGRAAQRLQAGNQRAAGQSRSRARRKPDRSAHPARQPQVLRHHARSRRSRKPPPRTSRCR